MSDAATPAAPNEQGRNQQGLKPVIQVAAGVILRPNGELLLGSRPADKPWPGWWELPGGKIEPGESVLQALKRELKEELDIDVTDATPWVTYVHEYPKNIVRLRFCRVTGWRGVPTGIEGQQLEWVDPHKPLPIGPVLPATEPPLRWLKLPERYLLTHIGNEAALPAYLATLQQAFSDGIRMIQFREPAWAAGTDHDALYRAFRQVLQACRRAGALCIVNSVHPRSWWREADGVQLRAADAAGLLNAEMQSASARPQHDDSSPDAGAPPQSLLMQDRPHWLAVSAHNAEDLENARRLGADFAVLGHVLDTPSHSGQPGIGWDRFFALREDAGLPVYAIGGQSMQTLPTAKAHGAHGIAGIRQIA